MSAYANLYLQHLGDRVARLGALEPVTKKKGEFVYRMGQPINRLLFIERGLTSSRRVTADGQAVELFALGGVCGIIGSHTLLHPAESVYEYLVRIEIEGHWVSREALHQLIANDPAVNAWIGKMAAHTSSVIADVTACRGTPFHTDEGRICSRLLVLRDMLGTNRIALTREALAEMVPTSTRYWHRRARARLNGIVIGAHGYVEICDAEALASLACPCAARIIEGRRRFIESLRLS